MSLSAALLYCDPPIPVYPSSCSRYLVCRILFLSVSLFSFFFVINCCCNLPVSAQVFISSNKRWDAKPTCSEALCVSACKTRCVHVCVALLCRAKPIHHPQWRRLWASDQLRLALWGQSLKWDFSTTDPCSAPLTFCQENRNDLWPRDLWAATVFLQVTTHQLQPTVPKPRQTECASVEMRPRWVEDHRGVKWRVNFGSLEKRRTRYLTKLPGITGLLISLMS